MTDDELKELIESNATLILDLNEKVDSLLVAQKANEIRIGQLENSIARINFSNVRIQNIYDGFDTFLSSDEYLSNEDAVDVKDFFYRKLSDLLEKEIIGKMAFNSISTNEGGSRVKGFPSTSDLIEMHGNGIIFLIKCVKQATTIDVVELKDKQVENIKHFHKVYATHSFYLGIASFSFDKIVEKFAKDNGVAILRQKGDVVEIDADNLKAY